MRPKLVTRLAISGFHSAESLGEECWILGYSYEYRLGDRSVLPTGLSELKLALLFDGARPGRLPKVSDARTCRRKHPQS